MELFPDIGVQTGQLTVISISQRTENDMSAWSPDMEEERDDLMASVSPWIKSTRNFFSIKYCLLKMIAQTFGKKPLRIERVCNGEVSLGQGGGGELPYKSNGGDCYTFQ